jgi:hypothetical protein
LRFLFVKSKEGAKNMISIPNLNTPTNDTKPIFIGKAMTKSAQWYLKLEKENINNLQLALDNNNFSLLICLGEQIYGNGNSFGFPYISKVGKSIQLAATQKDYRRLSVLIDVLKSYLQNMSLVYV